MELFFKELNIYSICRSKVISSFRILIYHTMLNALSFTNLYNKIPCNGGFYYHSTIIGGDC